MSETAPFPAIDSMPDDHTSSLRVPPHSVEAEQAVIGGLLLDNRAWETIADKLVDEDFYRNDHRMLFASIRELESRNEPFDAVTLSQRLEQNGQLEQAGGLLYLGRLAKDTPSASNILAYANIVREKSVLRQLISVGTDISGSGYVPEGRDSKELLDNAEKKVFQIAEQGARGEGGFQDMKLLLSKTVDKIDHLFNSDGGITGVSTGFDKFDEMTTGLQEADLVIVAGRPSMGKTTFAMNIAEHVALKSGKPTLFISLEMAAIELIERMLCSVAKVNGHRLRNGTLPSEDRKRLVKIASELSTIPLFIDDSPTRNVSEIAGAARRIKRREKELGLVVVDYL